VSEFGFCTARANQGGISDTIRGSMSLVCLAPFQPADWTLVRIQSRRTGQFQTAGTRQDVSFSPYPTVVSAMVWTDVRAAMLVTDASNLDFVLEARHAEAHFERTLDIPEIRLDQYRDTPPGAMQ
jgi:citrate lyase gamma subunit